MHACNWQREEQHAIGTVRNERLKCRRRASDRATMRNLRRNAQIFYKQTEGKDERFNARN